MSEAASLIRIGIMGCADIARKLSSAISLAPNAHLAAIASRSHDKAAKFAQDNGFPAEAKIHGTYESLLDDPDVDAVYMPLPTGLHVQWAVRAAQKGKHVLLEKPVGLHVTEFDRIIEACEANGVQIMDGTMWMHHPRTPKLREFLSDTERFGQLKTINTIFSFHVDADFLKNDIRVKPELDGLGALGDVGWYAIRAILFAADYELPKTVIAARNPVLNEVGVILSCGATLYWADGKKATFHVSFLENLTMDMTVTGTKGTLHVHDFVIPFKEHEASFTTGTKLWFDERVSGWSPLPSQHTITTEICQEACMVREFCRLVGNIKRNGMKPDKFWPTISRKTQVVIDAVKLSIEKGFDTVDVAK